MDIDDFFSRYFNSQFKWAPIVGLLLMLDLFAILPTLGVFLNRLFNIPDLEEYVTELLTA